jgi:DNA segregation ATPase FtsK/SpoIIIE, S-DNA-T family
VNAGITRPLKSPQNSRGEPEPPHSAHYLLEVKVLALGALWLALVVALLSYRTADRAFSTSGTSVTTHNWLGSLGAWVADFVYYIAGFSVWWLVLWCGALFVWPSLRRLLHIGHPRPAPEHAMPAWRRYMPVLGLFLLLLGSWMLESTRLYGLTDKLPYTAGGVLGNALGPFVERWVGFTASALIALVLCTLGLSLAFSFSWMKVCERVGAFFDHRFGRARQLREQQDEALADIAVGAQAVAEREQAVERERIELEAHNAAAPLVIEKPVLEVPQSKRVAKEKQKALFSDMPDSPLPALDLLDAPPPKQESVSVDTLEYTSRLIEKKLSDFGVQVRVVAAYPGPVITRYEIEPNTGVKGAQVVNLARDLARSLSVQSIRVVETIPGKNYMALELPNPKRQMIRHSEILGSQAYADAHSTIAIGLGKDIVGNPVVVDLGKMPHLLVAGTTGSGKSVGINAMILSLLYKSSPEDVRLILIDPKMLEMSVYDHIPHLLAPVVTDMKQAAHALNWCVAEMERRYKLMSKLGVRQLSSYNTKIAEAKERGEFVNNPLSLTPEAPEPLGHLPHIVVVIDELADLMMVVGKKIEELIARLAQKARAAGIHLILATQRPSVDVITGLIKANVPSRIAFQVSSKIDSRTILDQMGAESLLGMGDMLYMPVGQTPMRVHGAFVSDAEVHRVATFLKSQGAPDYVDGILTGESEIAEQSSWQMEGIVPPEKGAESSDGESDPLYDQAVQVVLQNRKASISLVQRHLRVGYNRSARLLEQMEKSGLIGKLQPNGQRDVIAPSRSEA